MVFQRKGTLKIVFWRKVRMIPFFLNLTGWNKRPFIKIKDKHGVYFTFWRSDEGWKAIDELPSNWPYGLLFVLLKAFEQEYKNLIES